MKIRSKVNYRTIKKSLLAGFANNVLNTLFVNIVVFMTPPMTAAVLLALKQDFDDKYDRYTKRTISKGDMLASRAALIAALDTLSAYVNTVADGNPIIILEGGFEPTKGTASDTNPPVQPTGVTFAKGITGQFITECDLIPGAISYNAALSANEPIPDYIAMNGLGQLVVMDDGAGSSTPGSGSASVPQIKFILDFNKSRKKTFTGLQIGTTYYLYYWAMNSAGVSPMSDGVSKKMVEW